MGVWEDALREAAAQRYEEVQALARQREQVAEQARALTDFMEGMRRMQIRPQRQPFLVIKGAPGQESYRASRRHKILGWDVGATAVVTPDGSVFDMTNQDKEPCDLRRPVRFPSASDRSQLLSELLDDALSRAMDRGRS